MEFLPTLWCDRGKCTTGSSSGKRRECSQHRGATNFYCPAWSNVTCLYLNGLRRSISDFICCQMNFPSPFVCFSGLSQFGDGRTGIHIFAFIAFECIYLDTNSLCHKCRQKNPHFIVILWWRKSCKKYCTIWCWTDEKSFPWLHLVFTTNVFFGCWFSCYFFFTTK